MTLKRRVVEKLATMDKTSGLWKSKLILDLNLIALVVTSILAYRAGIAWEAIIWTLIAGQCLGWSANFAHNFMHQADNWRMLTANLSFINHRDFRVFHAMSHHMFPNTYTDLEVSFQEPNLKWIPYPDKTRCGTVIAVLLWPYIVGRMFIGAFVLR